MQSLRALFPFRESTLARLRELCGELRDNLSLALDVLQIDSSTATLEKLVVLEQSNSSISGNIDSLNDNYGLVSRDVHAINVSLGDTADHIRGLTLTDKSDEYHKILDWLSSLTVEFERKHSETFNMCGWQDGMGRWLLETTEFCSWLEGTGEILWCPGKCKQPLFLIVLAFCGYSYADLNRGSWEDRLGVRFSSSVNLLRMPISSFITNHRQGLVDRMEARLAYIYIGYKEREKQTPANLMRSLARHLAASESTLTAKLESLYQSHRYAGTDPSLAECSQLLQDERCRYSKVFIVVDAIDEISDEYRDILLAELQQLQPKASILITSRDLPNMAQQLENAVRLKFEAKDEDIVQYLK